VSSKQEKGRRASATTATALLTTTMFEFDFSSNAERLVAFLLVVALLAVALV
jgi:hypothetical protein